MGLLRFTGADAERFLQGQVSNDTGRLRAGEPLLAAHCTAQGRVFALLRLLPHSAGILGVLPHELAAPTLERLRRFVLRAKVSIEDASALYAVAGLHELAALDAAGLRPPEAGRGYAEMDGIGIARVGAGASRFWVIGPEPALAQRGLRDAAEPAPRIDRDWRLADIRAGLPQVYAATSELFVPQMLNLDLIDGISFAKGCYTGQEIVARTQHLGRIKRRMHRLHLPPGSWAVGQSFKLADGRPGRLTELASVDDSFEALAVLSEAGAAEAGNAVADSRGAAAETAPSEAVEAASLALPYPIDLPGPP